MSGGSMNYVYSRIETECVGNMGDHELDDLMKDIVKLVHDREWCLSDDIGEEDYRKSVEKFKEKWFKASRTIRMRGYVEDMFKAAREKCLVMIGDEDNPVETVYDEFVAKYGEFVNKSTAAKIIGVTRVTVYTMIKDGRLRTGFAGKKVNVRSIVDYIRSQGGV